jgi:MFS transporter, DHA1 family, inner membrane transport protein
VPETAVAPLTNSQLALVTVVRLAITVAFRIIYPLQPFLADQMRVDLQTVSALVTIQLLASLASPIGGMLADARGERSMMSAGIGIFCLGALACALSASLPGYLFGYALIGLGMACFLPAATSYLSARTPYSRRGWALGIFETSWAGAALLGVTPLMFVVQATRSATPVYWALVVAGVISLIVVRVALPATPRVARHDRRPIPWGDLRSLSLAAMIGLMTLMMFALDLYNVSQGVWLQSSFGATEGMLGIAVGVAGVAELCGSVAVALLVDRIGKKRAVIGGYICAALALAALPLTGGAWGLLLVVLFVFFLAEEFAIVASFPLASGIVPTARGTALSLMIMISSAGRALGASISPQIWERLGAVGITLIGAAVMGLGVVICWRGVREVEVDP